MPSVSAGILVVVCLAQPGPGATGVADAVTLRDGGVVLGELVESTARGSTSIYVRRDWARKNLPEWAERVWEKADAPLTRRAVGLRRQRLEAWRHDRKVGGATGPDDRISPWIDRELKRLGDEGTLSTSPLMLVRLARNDVRSVSRAPKGRSGLLRLAWISEFPGPETMSTSDLKEALESRGFDTSSKRSVSIDALLPPQVEADAAWLVRRAATEVSYDPDLKFIRYQGLVLPEGQAGQGFNPQDAMGGLSVLKELLGEKPVDPLPARLSGVAKRGLVGALVTKLDVEPDLSGVTVTIALWVRHPRDRWIASGSRTSRVRPEDLGPDAGKELGDDPQVSAAFQIAESLGLGQAVRDVKQRTLSVGAATRKALGEARTLANGDLAKLALPVLDAVKEAKVADESAKQE